MKKQSFLLLTGVSALAIIAQFIMTDAPHTTHHQASMLSTSNSQVSSGTYAEKYNGSLFNSEVTVNNLYRSTNQLIGYGIWLNRKSQKIKAKYFAFKNGTKSVAERFNEWKYGKKIVLYCSGAYTTSDYTAPVGLTIDNGMLVNRSIDNTMDAMVLVEGVGGIRISDLDLGSFYVQSLGRSIDPRNSFQLQTLIDWASREQASLFQTNLLCYKNSMKCGDVPDTAERRILVIGQQSNGEVAHIIYDISEQVSLTDAAKSIYNNLTQQKNFYITGMVNLDTGMKNIFQLYDQNGKSIDFIKGKENAAEPSNLIVYYYE